ncbi:MAG: helix-turn-helix domain-containing protein, partial [Spirochaetia bacterium]|nr:helix-turn-helix domain-containing protein [Spirochaetia bacterium]
MEALLTVKEAAEITRLKTKTLYAYAERRIIPHPGRKQASCSGMHPYPGRKQASCSGMHPYPGRKQASCSGMHPYP